MESVRTTVTLDGKLSPDDCSSYFKAQSGKPSPGHLHPKQSEPFTPKRPYCPLLTITIPISPGAPSSLDRLFLFFCFSFNLYNTAFINRNYHLHFTKGETEAQRDKIVARDDSARTCAGQSDHKAHPFHFATVIELAGYESNPLWTVRSLRAGMGSGSPPNHQKTLHDTEEYLLRRTQTRSLI